MQINKVILSYFSPTHTSRAYARSFAEATGFAVDAQALDATYETLAPVTLSGDELLVVAVPVYGGRVAPLALKRLEALRGDNTPAVVLTVYGNRDFGGAPVELAEFLRARGFVTVAAGAVVAEHSYSAEATPIAAGRPSLEDFGRVAAFAAKVAEKLKSSRCPVAVDPSELKCPPSGLLALLRFALFVIDHRRRAKRRPVRIAAACDPRRCKACGRCVRECPVGAIPAEDPARTDAERCIKCAACVKCCAAGARSLTTPFAPVLSKNFRRQKPGVFVL